MDPMFVHPLAVCGIFCIWDYYRKLRVKQQRVLRDRVAFMVWRAAQLAD